MSKLYVFILLEKKIMELLSLFQLLVIMNWLFLFLSFNNKKNILVIAIVYLQFIFINLSMCSILTKKVIYIYIYISAVVHGL